ncbi:hypothetical protein BV22DRAFT_1121762, partial [Leucogyrophana mollusca]
MTDFLVLRIGGAPTPSSGSQAESTAVPVVACAARMDQCTVTISEPSLGEIASQATPTVSSAPESTQAVESVLNDSTTEYISSILLEESSALSGKVVLNLQSLPLVVVAASTAI